MAEMLIGAVNPDGTYINATPGSTTILGQPIQTVTLAGVSSIHAAGSAANAVAGQAIVTMSAPPAGFYQIDVHRSADGSGTPSLYNNGDFRVGALTPMVLLSVPELGIQYFYTFYVNLDGTQALSVNAVTNVSNNITITASITATRIR